MLLTHQTGSVKIGEVVRYTVTYTPSQDRILPSPERLYVRVKNTCAVALRAAFVHGPYTLSVAAYPTDFNPNEKAADPRTHGVPEFEPMVKAAGSWECELVVPENVRQAAATGGTGVFGKTAEHDAECASWVIEVSSQVIFSTSAVVGYEVLVARDRKSLGLGGPLSNMSSQQHTPQPGRLADYQQSIGAKDGHHPAQPGGIYSRAIHLKVEDTATLWNTPRLPSWDDQGDERVKSRPGSEKPVESMVETGDAETKQETKEEQKPRKQKKVHLVVLTHGLHSNLGADMLFMKESIDAAVKQAKIDAKARKTKERASRGRSKKAQDADDEDETSEGKPASPETEEEEDESDDEEETIVRGYSGNATKTERGIKYLGKRLARYILSMTYPDQPFLPIGKDIAEHTTHAVKGDKNESDLKPAHKHSTVQGAGHPGKRQAEKRPYKITSISFIAHSLGGLVQTYAVAYVQKHSPQFFDLIKPINFIALATPWLGLSNENPIYVKFALDSGLVGRTGKDLGLTWRAPTLARSGWGALVSNLGETAHKKVYGESQPESKPLLRILPTGPAHTALKKFRNRTVYSNVVNDGIVPLRTSCLLFLDWHGLGRVDKARRDAGLVETMVGFGWAELTGTNLVNSRQKQLTSPSAEDQSDSGTDTPKGNMSKVPQPATDAVEADERASIGSVPTPMDDSSSSQGGGEQNGPPGVPGAISGFFNLFKSNDPPKEQPITQKQRRIYDKSQTTKQDLGSTSTFTSSETDPQRPPLVTSGSELEGDLAGLNTPPRTTFFEAAGDLLNPKVPDVEYIIDPSKRPRTIFHDRVYHPSDIPPPPMKRRQTSFLRKKTMSRSNTGFQSNTSNASSSAHGSAKDDAGISSKDEDPSSGNDSPHDVHQPEEVVDISNMRVEEKIARGYHWDLSWRKVLVKLEPDAHNNIFVRRMFVNAYGWPVVKHMVDVHFSDSAVARMRTDDEYLGERALDINQPPDAHGGEIKADPSSAAVSRSASTGDDNRTESETREAQDQVSDLRSKDKGKQQQQAPEANPLERGDSATWSDRDFDDSEYESDFDFSDGKTDTSPKSSKDSKSGKNSKSGKEKREGSPGKEWNWAEKIVGKGGSGKSRSSSLAKSPEATSPVAKTAEAKTSEDKTSAAKGHETKTSEVKDQYTKNPDMKSPTAGTSSSKKNN